MRRTLTMTYGLVSYTIGMGSIVYMMGWLANLFVPRSIDSAATGSLAKAVCVNTMLFVLFGLQHSVMARPKFKAWLTQFLPESIERSTYVMISGIAMLGMMLLWQPMGGPVWDVQNTVGRAVLYVLYGTGWAILVGSTFALNHFDLFGVRQTWLAFRGHSYTHLKFATPGPYRIVRHPLYVGWITLVWATPTMTLAHLAFAVATTVYILVAIQFEERDLITFHGDNYRAYKATTPMLIPGKVPQRIAPKPAEIM